MQRDCLLSFFRFLLLLLPLFFVFSEIIAHFLMMTGVLPRYCKTVSRCSLNRRYPNGT